MTAPWELRSVDADLVGRLAQELRLSPVTAQCLAARGLEQSPQVREFLQPRLAALRPPTGMAGMQDAVTALAQAVQRGAVFGVFGDYDVDGTTSAAILADVIARFGGEVVAFVANRFEGGYGFSARALARVRGCDPHLIITCDCGSADHERIVTANDAGIDVVVSMRRRGPISAKLGKG